MHVYVVYYRTADGYLRNLLGMKYSLPALVFKLFGPIRLGADPGQGQEYVNEGFLLQSVRLQQQTVCITVLVM